MNYKVNCKDFLQIGAYMCGAALLARFGLDAAINAHHCIDLSKEVLNNPNQVEPLIVKSLFVVTDLYVINYIAKKMFKKLDEFYGLNKKKEMTNNEDSERQIAPSTLRHKI